MNPCETASTITAIACAIAKCVSKEELTLLTAALGQLASTLATITVQEELLASGNNPPPTTPNPEETIITI